MTDSIIEKITNTNPESKSLDIEAKNIEQLKQLFPDVFSEGKVDFEALKAALGDHVEDKEERYNFTWHGKNKARQIAQTPSTGTLRPCKEESVNWDTTQNLFIEGDNLEVLKLLQKSYHKKVKMIYIDPPYNTGKDFVYKDNFFDNVNNYLKITNQVDSKGLKVSANSDSSGRYHTDWLNMMYPRLKLARNLLSDDGVIFISIDDNEVTNLKKLCDEIFGEDNFIVDLIWEKRFTRNNDAKLMSSVTEHILFYRKSHSRLSLREPRTEKSDSIYKNQDNDPRGKWTSVSFISQRTKEQRPNLSYEMLNPITNEIVSHPVNAWKYSKEKYEELASENRLYWGIDGKNTYPRLKRFLAELSEGIVPINLWNYKDTGTVDDGTKMVDSLVGKDVFDYPKPISLVQRMMAMALGKDDLVLDFFAGSSTTAHACLDLNAKDKGNRRFIMVQLPEQVDEKSIAKKVGHTTIADISRERIRKASDLIKKNHEGYKGDLGFKSLKLNTTNIIQWEPSFDNLSDILDNSVESIKAERTSEDVLFEILLKYGLDLTYPIIEHILADKTVYEVAFGALIICLDEGITRQTVEAIGKLKQELDSETTRVVFKDAGFADDAVKVNAIQLLKQYGVDDVKSI